MISKCIVFLVAALLLANCCISGSGCGAPTGSPVAWDGLGPAPAEDTQAIEPTPNRVHSKKDIAARPLQNGKPQSGDSWERQQATDQDEEARLKRKLVICRDCVAPEPKRDDARASAAR